MNALIMLLLGIMLAIKSTSGSSAGVTYSVPINSTYVVIASTNNSFIIYLLTAQNDIKYAVMVVPKSGIKTINVTAPFSFTTAIVGGQGIFPGILDFNNGTGYVGFYEGHFNNTRFVGFFIPVIETGGLKTPAYPVTSGLVNANFTVTVKSEIPVVLRFYSFNGYNSSTNTLTNTQSLTPVITGYPPITIGMAVGDECRTYMVYESFSQPIEAIPEPFVINYGKDLSFIVSNITLVSVYPNSKVSVLEPGDLLLSYQPIISAVFEITVCSISQGMNYSGIETLYARDYLGPIDVGVSWSSVIYYLGPFNTEGMSAINELLNYMNNGRFQISRNTYSVNYTLTHGLGSPVDYALLTLYVLRMLGIPSRITIGFVGEQSGNGDYIFQSSHTTIWVEAFTNVGWVAFEPINIQSHGSNIPIYVLLLVAFASFLLMVPWLIGYYIYYYLGRRSLDSIE
mgnify:CR=1 FL=1